MANTKPTKTHWKKLQNPDYLGSYALEPGQDIIATIKTVNVEKVTGPDGKKEDCTVLHFVEPNIKPMILNATNAKTITKIYKTPYIEDWANRAIQIYVDEVMAFGSRVEALRIRQFVPSVKVKTNNAPVACADCGAVIEAFNGRSAAYMAQYTQDKYGKPLCAACAKKAAEDKTNAENEAGELTAALDAAISTEAEKDDKERFCNA